MTSRNIQWNSINKAASIKAKPFLLRPSGKNYLWGGNRLNDEYAKNIDMQPLAETWECSTHPDGPSTVASGDEKGRLLSEVIEEHQEYIGTHPRSFISYNTEICGGLPILIKMIDAKKNLSIQVHPNDEFARKYENGQLGKTEMWYVLDAGRDTELIYGLYRDVDKEMLYQSIQEGRVEKYLQKVRIQKDEVYYVEAGMIHAVGAGALLLEIQENSNITYRLYDYDRLDSNGEKRELHIKKALEVAKLRGSSKPSQPMRVLSYRLGVASELLCRCRYFEVHRMIINTERCRQMVDYRADSMSFRVLLCINGCGSILMVDGEVVHFFKGDCIFFPADSMWVSLHGKAQFVEVRG